MDKKLHNIKGFLNLILEGPFIKYLFPRLVIAYHFDRGHIPRKVPDLEFLTYPKSNPIGESFGVKYLLLSNPTSKSIILE